VSRLDTPSRVFGRLAAAGTQPISRADGSGIDPIISGRSRIAMRTSLALRSSLDPVL